MRATLSPASLVVCQEAVYAQACWGDWTAGKAARSKQWCPNQSALPPV
jgi:hypothetical protein